MMIVWILLVLQ